MRVSYRKAVYMKEFPIITKDKQKLYEKIFCGNEKLQNCTSCICGYYGRGCRRINRLANGVSCVDCSLRIFASTIEAIKEQCDEKETLEIEFLYDSDILDIQTKLKNDAVNVEGSYIETILDALVNLE